MTIKDSIISRNIGVLGGGIYNDYSEGDMNKGARLTISGTTQITNNQATSDHGGGIMVYSINNAVTLDGPDVAVKSNKAHLPSPSELSWYQGWGVYANSGIPPTTTNGFNPATQVTDNAQN